MTFTTFDFDTTSAEYIHTLPIGMPKSWNESTVTAIVYWTNTGGASTETVRFTVAGAAVSNTLNTTFGTAVNIDDTWLAHDQHITAESSAITIGATPAENDMVIFQVSRDVANDNMAGDAKFIGMKILYNERGDRRMKTRYALVAPDNSVLRIESGIDPAVATKPGYRWATYSKVVPAFNADTQVMEGPVRSVTADSVTDTWTVRPKTAGELDAEKDNYINAIDRLQFLIAFDMENRVRVIEGKAQITAAQYRSALKARL